jgi:hypothetical protein
MGFDSGSLSFRRFAVIGDAPQAVDQQLLDKLSEHALRPGDLGAPEEIEYGWSGGRHVLDDQFTFENNVFADSLHFALRTDTNKVPSELARAYKLMEEDVLAKGNPSGFISKKQKKDAKDVAQRKVDEELRSGKYRRSKLTPILWDLSTGMLYCNASIKIQEQLLEIFERTFGLSLQPLSAGSMAQRMAESKGRRRDYEDASPTRFAIGPDGEGQSAEYPWVAKGPEAKDFLGNEFFVWLWHQAQSHSGVISLGSSDASIFFDKSLDLDCVFGQTGRDGLRGDGVTQMPEAVDALRSGKVPRKAGIILESSGAQYTLTLSAEALAAGSLKLPNVEEAENPRVLFEERISMLRDFTVVLENLYGAFLKIRFSSAWESQVTTIRQWIMQSRRAIATAAVA